MMTGVPFRLATIGESSVGKTSIIRIISGESFDCSESTTVGVDFGQLELKVDNKIANLEIWDTAGQERFRSLVPVYCRNVNATFAVFDVTNYESYEKLEGWINLFKSLGDENRFVFIVANKIDLKDERQVDLEKAEEWSKEKGYKIYYVSAKTGEGISEMIQSVVKTLFEAFPGHEVVDEAPVITETNKKKGCC